MSSHPYSHRRNPSQPQVLPSPTKSTLTDDAFDGDHHHIEHSGQSQTPFRGDFEREDLIGSARNGNGHTNGVIEEEDNQHVGFAIGGESDDEEEEYREPNTNGEGDGYQTYGSSGIGINHPPPTTTNDFNYPRAMSRDQTPRQTQQRYPPSPSPPNASLPITNTNSNSTTPLPPYLTLLPRLSLIPLTSLPLLSLLLLLLPSLLSSSKSFTNSLSDLQASIGAKCQGVAAGVEPWLTGEGESSLWRVMRDRAEEEMRKGVMGSVVGLEVVLNDSITIMEQVINFMIDTYRSLLLCTIVFAVQGTLAILLAAVQLISSSVTSSLNTIRTSIQSDITSANSVIQTAVASINTVTSVVHVTLSVPQFSIPSLSALQNVTFPTTIQNELIKLNSSIPDLAGLRNLVNELVDMPFEELRGKMNTSFTGLIKDINSTVTSSSNTTTLSKLATTSSNSSSDLCANIDTSFLSTASAAVTKLTNITIGLLILAFFLLLFAMAAWEWYTYKCMVNHAQSVEQTLERDMLEGRTMDGMRIVNVVEHPVLEKYLGPVLGRVTRDGRKQDGIRWFFSYITHITALALLLFGIISLLTVQLEIDAIQALKTHTVKQSSNAVETEATNFAASLNNVALAQSTAYANDMNKVIQGWQSKVNNDLFGSWVNTTTVVLNSTLVEFYSEVETLLNETFGGTILAAPINTFVYCLIGSKISNLETALTWVNEHAHLTLPVVSTNALLLPNATMQALVTPIVAAATGSGSSTGNDGLIGELFDRYLADLYRQRTAAGLFLALYGIIVLIGLLVVLWSLFMADRFNRWRLGFRRLQTRRSGDLATGPAPTYLAQSGMGRKWSYVEKDVNTSDHPVNNEKYSQAPSPPPDKEGPGLKPFYLASSANNTVFPKKKPVPKISYPVSQERPAIGKHLSSWSTKVTGAVSNMLQVPGIKGNDLNRNQSQRSERSWTGMEPSPWVDRGTQRSTPTTAASGRSSMPSNTVPGNNNPRDWSAVYPRDDQNRYPAADFRPDLLQSQTPIADSYKWTDTEVRRLPPLGPFAPDKQNHRVGDSF